jgi:hypothetical protein
MIFISATWLQVKSVLYLVRFMIANEASVKQLNKTEGFLGGRELIDKNLTFWTLTIWDSEVSMKQFRNSLPHRKAMQKLPFWCGEASYIHWTQAENQFPGWITIHEKMLAEGKTTKVRNPSENQPSKNYPEIKWRKLERNFKPAGKR